jgi:hypothetical protein
MMTASPMGAHARRSELWELTNMAVAIARIDSGRASWPEVVFPAISLLAAPMLLVEGIAYRFQSEDPTPLSGLLGLIYVVGWMLSLIGLWRLNAVGRGAGRVVLGLQMLGVFLATIWAVITLVNPTPDQNALYYQVVDTAWPVSHLFMLATGVAVIVAGTLPGWRRFTPLLCGLSIALCGLVIGLTGTEFVGRALFGFATTGSFALLALAVRGAWQTPSQGRSEAA